MWVALSINGQSHFHDLITHVYHVVRRFWLKDACSYVKKQFDACSWP